MLGLSFGELFLIIGATAALIKPKDLPIIARTAGRLVGRAVGHAMKARGQFDSVMQHSQASQVLKEVKDEMARFEAIRYEMRSMLIMNPAPFTRSRDGAEPPSKPDGEHKPSVIIPKDLSSMNTIPSNLHSQAMAYAKLAESPTIKSGSYKLKEDGGLLNVLPISAESAGLLPKRTGELKGSDIALQAILEAEVARNAKIFFAQPQNQLPKE